MLNAKEYLDLLIGMAEVISIIITICLPIGVAIVYIVGREEKEEKPDSFDHFTF